MTKLQLAQKRNYFKFVLMGMFKPIDANVLTPYELQKFKELMEIRKELIESFDVNSKIKGLNVPEHRCWCGKEGKYKTDYTNKLVCKKHLNNN